MDGYMTSEEAADKWGISARRVQILCKKGVVCRAEKHGGVWFVPECSDRPDPRKPGSKQKKDLHVMSLFSGCGGMDLGFEGGFDVLRKSVNTDIHPDWKIKADGKDWVRLPETRFTTVFANDIREDARSLWVNYFRTKGIAKSVFCLDSIVDLVKLHKENLKMIFPHDIDVVTGGFPCQDFSVAGKREGFLSTTSHLGGKRTADIPSIESRGQLYIWMREVISLVQPKMFIAENVKGLANLADVKEIIEHDFADACHGGYVVIPAKVLHVADYGVPQNRERIIFFGFKKSALLPEALAALSSPVVPATYDPYPRYTHRYTSDAVGDSLKHFVSVGDCFTGLPEPNRSNDLSQQAYSCAKYMGKHCQGQTEVNLQGIGPTIRSEHHGNIEFRRLSKEHGGMHDEELRAGLTERRLSIRECARIQTFPDDYDFILKASAENKPVSAGSAYKVIGNAVPPLFAFNIAMSIQEKWRTYFGDAE